MAKSARFISVFAAALIAVSMTSYTNTMDVSAASVTAGVTSSVDVISVKGTKINYTGDVYATSYAGGNPVKVSGTYTVVAVVSDTSRKCRVQLKDTGWIKTSDMSEYTMSKDSSGNITVVQNKYAENTSASSSTAVKVGDKVKYSGDAYYTSDGGKSVKVSGTYTVAAIKENAKYNVQLKGIGWVSLSNASTTPTTPETKPSTSTVKVGDKVKYSGDAYYTSDGGKSVKVSGTYTVAAIKENAKYNVQLKGIGWVSLSNASTTPTTPETKPSTSTVKVGDKVKYSGDAYYTSAGGKSVKVSGTYTVAAIKENAKYNVQLKGVGWVSLSNASTTPTTPETKPSTSTVKVGDKVKYSGDAYYTSAGGKSVKVSGTYTVAAIKENAKYNVQLKGVGWVSLSNASTTPETKPSTSTIKVGDKVKFSGDAYYTSAGGKSVKVSGTYTVAAIKENAKYNVQLKGIGWVSMSSLKLA